MSLPNSATGTSRSNRVVLRLVLWTTAYVVSTALAAFGPEFLWPGHRPLTIGAVALNLGVGVVMILAK